MTGNIYPAKLEIINSLIELINIMMREGLMTKEEMRTIGHIIFAFKTTKEDLRHLDNFSIILEPKMK